MTRRQSVRFAMFAAIGMVIGKYNSVEAKESTGLLTCNLDLFRTVRFTHAGKAINIPVSEIFAAIASGTGVAVTKPGNAGTSPQEDR